MPNLQTPSKKDKRLLDCTKLLFAAQQDQVYRRTDKLFAGLMIFQWFAAIITALWISPTTWQGTESMIPPL